MTRSGRPSPGLVSNARCENIPISDACTSLSRLSVKTFNPMLRGIAGKVLPVGLRQTVKADIPVFRGGLFTGYDRPGEAMLSGAAVRGGRRHGAAVPGWRLRHPAVRDGPDAPAGVSNGNSREPACRAEVVYLPYCTDRHETVDDDPEEVRLWTRGCGNRVQR